MVEVLIGVALLGVILLVGLKFYVSVKGLLPERSVTVAGDTLRVAPSEAAFTEAIQLHSVLLERLNEAKAVYVFGGEHEGIPSSSSVASQLPLSASALPSLTNFTSGLPQDAHGFYQAYSGALGPVESSSTPSDFSVLLVGKRAGNLALISLVQVRSTEVAVSDGDRSESFVRRAVTLYDFGGTTWSYSYLERPSIASSITVGARHFWYRYFEGRVAEEGPTSVVFPDPWIFGGSRASASYEPPAFSQFTYLVEVSP